MRERVEQIRDRPRATSRLHQADGTGEWRGRCAWHRPSSLKTVRASVVMLLAGVKDRHRLQSSVVDDTGIANEESSDIVHDGVQPYCIVGIRNDLLSGAEDFGY